MKMPSFQYRDSTGPAFWDERFEQAFTPWDQAGVPAPLPQFVAEMPMPLVTLIPGCGLGHEVALLSEAGWDVAAIDFSSVAVDAARKRLGKWAGRVIEADFFTFVPPRPLGLIYERAFLCALPPSRSVEIVERWAALLPADGLLAGFFFFDKSQSGPPFGIDPERLNALLEPYFVRMADCRVDDSVPVFAGKERWQVWRRRG